MGRRKLDFAQSIKDKVLLWCKRHCCLCGKYCGTDIEVHHLVQPENGGKSSIENAIPLCFDCHSAVMKYNDNHPCGNKYRIAELKARREEIFEKNTAENLPQIHFEITQQLPNGDTRKLPNVGFNINHRGKSLPVKVTVAVESFWGMEFLGNFSKGNYYAGNRKWNLNSGGGVSGNFWLPKKVLNNRKKIELRVRVAVIDQFEREHKLLPVGWVYMRAFNQWYFNP